MSRRLQHWLHLPRVPEPEVMDDTGDVEAYSSAAAQTHLDRIDDTFVEHALRLLSGRLARGERGTVVDIGCGPGQIVLKLAHRLPGWRFVGLDRSAAMVGEALGARDAIMRGADGRIAMRVQFIVGDAAALPLGDAGADLVMCNSVLHHLREPATVFAEIARVAAPGAAILLRDLRRPSRPAYPWHVRWHGRHYTGLMYRLYCDSVRAAYTREELADLLHGSPLRDARIFTRGRTHLGFERAAR